MQRRQKISSGQLSLAKKLYKKTVGGGNSRGRPNFYNNYEELFTKNPKKNIAQLISYIPYWDSFDAREMEPRRYKNLADCIAHTYTGGDLIAGQRWDNDGERPKDFIIEGLDAHILYSHYKNEFKRYAVRNNLEVPRDCAADEDWIKLLTTCLRKL